MKELLSHVLDGARLSRADMRGCFAQILDGAVPPTQVAALLAALRTRTESVDEVVGAVEAVRAAAIVVPVEEDVVDTCGTGGDSSGSFNISTAAAIVAAAAGVSVAKHGNRSVSSKCGSSDVLEALGVRLDLSPVALAALIRTSRLGFLFAPAHHPAFKNVAALRKELGVRTLFNLVGPLANPARATRQVVGVFSERFVPLVASALHQLGTRHALVVHGGGLDEISVCGPTAAVEVTPSGLTPLTLEPNEWGIERHPLEALQGGDAATNAGLLNGILDGAPGARRDAVLVNAGAAIYVGGAVETIGDGVELARRTIDSGGARAHFDRFLRAQSETTILDDIVSRLPRLKSLGPVPAVSRPSTLRSLREALSAGEAPRIIAEVKRKSPGAGAIADIPDPAALARSYVSRGARAISVLTNGADFGGSLEDLRLVRRAVELPVLRKEFIVDVRQLDEAVEAGADAVLLIVALLGRGLARMHDAARRRGLECLVEVHDEAELEQALHAGVEMVGINNRNLKTMQVDLSVCERLARLVPSGQVVVAESGIHSQTALARLRNSGLENFLVGEFLVRGGAW